MAKAKLPVNVLTASDKLADRAVAHAVYLERFKTGEVNQVYQLLDGEVNPEIARILKKSLGKGTVTEAKLTQLSTAMTAYTKGAQSTIQKGVKSAAENLATREADIVALQMDNILPLDFQANTPSPRLLRELVSKETINGKFVKDWFKEWGGGTSSKIMQQVRLGVGLGEGVDKISRRLFGTVAQNFKDGILAEQKRHLKTLVRTTIANVSNRARDAVYKENDDVVKGVEILATLDSRTSAICRSEDGNIYPVDSGPRPPFHPNCRTTTIPVLKSWKELGINLKEAPAGTRASMNGQTSSRQSYGQWLKKQPKGVQDDVLGIAKAKLFRSGKVKMDGFVDARGKTLSLDQLERRAVGELQLGGAADQPKIDGLLDDLRTATDPKVKRSIRGKLRRLGHTGGLKKATAPTTPKVAPVKPVTPKVSTEGIKSGAEVRKELGLMQAANKKHNQAVQKKIIPLKSELDELKDSSKKWRTDISIETGNEEIKKAWLSNKISYNDYISSPEHQKMEALLLKRHKKEFKRINDLTTEINELALTSKRLSRDQIWKTFELPPQFHSSFTTKAPTKTIQKKAKKSTEFLSKIVHKDYGSTYTKDSFWPDYDELRPKSRAFHQTGTISVTARHDVGVLVHETGHYLEHSNESLSKAARKFRSSRTLGEKLQSLRKLTGNKTYDFDEMAWKDKFIDAYMGKKYRSSNGTEIMSMALEYLYRSPTDFMKKDPEMFEWIIDLIHGSAL